MAKKIPITRISKFFGSEDFSLEQDIGMEWLHGDMHFTMVLFRVDKKLSRNRNNNEVLCCYKRRQGNFRH